MKINKFTVSNVTAMNFCRNKALRKTLAAWCAFATLVTTCSPVWAFDASNFTGGSNASATDVPGGVQVDITSGIAVGNWDNFNVGGSQFVDFNYVNADPTAKATIYNLISGGKTTISGSILDNANDVNVWLINPAGIAFNSGSTVNIGGLFAAAAGTLSTTTPELLAGNNPSFSSLDAAVTVAEGVTFNNQAALFAGKTIDVQSDASAPGTTTAFGGPTTFVAGDAVTIDSISGGTVTLSGLTGTGANTVDLMGQFADNLAVKTKAGAVTANGGLQVGVVDSGVGDFTIEGANLTLAKGASLAVEGNLTAPTVIQNHTIAAGAGKSTVAVKGNIAGDIVQNSASKETTLEAAKITGNVLQNSDNKGSITTGEIGGNLEQYGGTIAGKADALDASKTELKLGGDVTQADGAVVKSSFVTVANDKTIALASTKNEIGGIGGSALAVDLVTTKDLTVKNLTTAAYDGDVSLDAGCCRLPSRRACRYRSARPRS